MKKAFLLVIALMLVLFSLGACGTPGADGKDGKSAYELAVENGYEGTETEWLASLAGEVGRDGKNGKSAYELAVENGYRRSEKDWLKSLVGKDGADGEDGKSAYELAVENGYKGSLAQWLASLKGTSGKDGADGEDGTDGQSAYELALAGGYKGTQVEWLASLVGADGQDGLSAYELAVENGYRGDIQTWLASLVGQKGTDGKDGKDGKDGLSAYEIAVENGYRGTPEAWLASLIGSKGEDGLTPEIGENGNWWIGTTDTGVPARGQDGVTPTVTVNANGYWVVNGVVLSVKATGERGEDGIGVTDAYVGEDYVLYLVLSNGTTIESGYVGPTYTVGFYDANSALILTISDVRHKTGVAAPEAPDRDGYRFIGWDKTFDAVTSDLSVTACYERIPVTAHNQLTFTWVESEGKTTVTLAILGDVRLFGLETTLLVDAVGMTLESITPVASGLLANITEDGVRVSYVCTSGEDLTAETDLLTLTFTNTSAVRSAEITPLLVDIFDKTFVTETYTVAGGSYEN